MDLAQQVFERLDELGKISEDSNCLTRQYGTEAMRRANDLVGSWMKQAGMEVHVDAIGNLIGHFRARLNIIKDGISDSSEAPLGTDIEYKCKICRGIVPSNPGKRRGCECGNIKFTEATNFRLSVRDCTQVQVVKGRRLNQLLLLGSHLDTVKNAGKYDGPLGVVLAIAAVEELKEKIIPFDIIVLGFADEEGVRFQSSYLGSRAMANSFDQQDLKRVDANGISLWDAIKNFGGNPANLFLCTFFSPDDIIGYVEVHIEQGPVLEQKNHSVGVVTAIAGQTRIRIKFEGKAGHAGTTPMTMRQDALAGAAEFIQRVENCGRNCAGIVTTVGQITCEPNVSNVIPASVTLSLDVRHQEDNVRQNVCEELKEIAAKLAEIRHLKFAWEPIQETASVPCDSALSSLLREAAKQHQPEVIDLPSGAGHDAAVMAKICPMSMLFVRCKAGLSHHPDESITVEDTRIALKTLTTFVTLLAQRSSPPC